MQLIKDSHFQVVISKNASSPQPQIAIWEGQHRCVAEKFLPDDETPSPERCAEIIIKHQLAGNTFIWKWKYKNTLSKNWSQHLYPQVWRDMVERVGQKAERAIEIITDLIREPLGDMAEVPF